MKPSIITGKQSRCKQEQLMPKSAHTIVEFIHLRLKQVKCHICCKFPRNIASVVQAVMISDNPARAAFKMVLRVVIIDSSHTHTSKVLVLCNLIHSSTQAVCQLVIFSFKIATRSVTGGRMNQLLSNQH